MAFTRNNGIRLYYEIEGDGSPVALVMGLGGSGRAWGMQRPALAKHHRLIVPDNRGVGHSDAPEGPYTMAELADDLAAVLDAAGVERAHLVGVSLGGLIVQEFHHRHPGRTRSLVLMSTGTGPQDPESVPAERAVQDALALERRTDAETEAAIRALVPWQYHPDYRQRVPDLADHLIAFHRREPQPAQGYHGQLAAVATHTPNAPRLGAVTVPCLVLHGDDDCIWPVANARLLAEGLPDARLEILERTGHMLPMERPQACNKALLRFFAEVDGAP